MVLLAAGIQSRAGQRLNFQGIAGRTEAAVVVAGDHYHFHGRKHGTVVRDESFPAGRPLRRNLGQYRFFHGSGGRRGCLGYGIRDPSGRGLFGIGRCIVPKPDLAVPRHRCAKGDEQKHEREQHHAGLFVFLRGTHPACACFPSWLALSHLLPSLPRALLR